MKLHYFRTVFPLSLLLLQSPCSFALSGEEEEMTLIYGDQATVSIATGAKQTLRSAPAIVDYSFGAENARTTRRNPPRRDSL